MSKPLPSIPESRCPHGYRASVVVGDGGWMVLTAPDQCMLCRHRRWQGPRFKVGGKKTIKKRRRIMLVECAEPGCCILVEPGKPHETPHVDPDVAVRDNTHPVPAAVEIDDSFCWHAPREWNTRTGFYMVSWCGRRGRPTDQSPDDLVDCRTCLRRRP